MSTIAEQLADFACRPASPEAERGRVVTMATYALDTLGVTLAGTTVASSAPVVRVLLAAAGKPEATLFGVGRVTCAWDAALGNGAMAHALELDDDHRTAVLHPGAVVMPAAFAASEAAGGSGAVFLKALLVGYEVTCRLGEVFRGSQFYHGVHPTPLCGAFGAAAAAAVAYGLDRNAFVHALGIAGTQAAGLTEWRSDGSWIKRLHPGRAAQSGVLAARLAQEGFTGPATIFEGPGGFFNAFSYGEPMDLEAMTRGLGEDYRALGTAIKPYACCRFAHGAIDLALEAVRSGTRASDIEAVSVRLYRTDVLTYHTEPKNTVDAQFNVPYLVAVALARGRVGLGDFTKAAVANSTILALSRRIAVTEDPGFTEVYPERYPTELKLRLKSGEVRTSFNDCPSGDPAAPQYHSDPHRLHGEAEDKIAGLFAETGFGDRFAPLKEAVAELVNAPDVLAVAGLLGSGPKAN